MMDDDSKVISGVHAIDISGSESVVIDVIGAFFISGQHRVQGGVLYITPDDDITINGGGIFVSGNTVDSTSSISISTKGSGSVFINGKRYKAPNKSVELRGNRVIIDGQRVSDSKEQAKKTRLRLDKAVRLSEIQTHGSASCELQNSHFLAKTLTIGAGGASHVEIPQTGFDALSVVTHGASTVNCGNSSCIDFKAVLRGSSKIFNINVAIEAEILGYGASYIQLRKMNDDTVIKERVKDAASIKISLI